MEKQKNLKRKVPDNGGKTQASSRQDAKRAKTQNARTILAQSSEKALNSNGDLDVAAFVKAREYEINALESAMTSAKHGLTTRAFQQVPRELRRRTASHNVKKVPKRLRARAAKEMILDNTPTVNSRNRKLDGHTRLRLEKAKELQKTNARSKVKRATTKEKKSTECTAEKQDSQAIQLPKPKQNVLSKPPIASSKFQKRQTNKSWLPTHMFHAKRAHMTPPKEPLWRFAIPLTPTEKSYRPTHRAANDKGCVAWDTSYMSTIGVQGQVESLLGLLRSMGVPETFLSSPLASKWKRGARSWSGWLRERDSVDQWITHVTVIWCAKPSDPTMEKEDRHKAPAADEDKPLDNRQTEDENVEQENHQDTGQEDLDGMDLREPQEADPQELPLVGLEEEHEKELDGLHGGAQSIVEHGQSSKQEILSELEQRIVASRQKKARGSLFIRVHPSAFLQLWNEVLKVAKLQRPQPSIEDLRFEIGSIGITGPSASEGLIAVLKPRLSNPFETLPVNVVAEVWSSLLGVTSPATLPPGTVLGFNCADPRLGPPLPKVKVNEESDDDKLLQVLAAWPLDKTHCVAEIFDRNARLAASRLLPSQKSINRRKGDCLPGESVSPLPSDPEIPILVLASRSDNGNSTQGSWTVLMPWKCIQPVWYSLMYCPLSVGGTPRFGGLDEERQLTFEHATPWFPGDFPGTKAGWDWELREREKREADWAKRPKGKRIEWDSLDLGGGKRGEIGRGWACDWERLFAGPPNTAGKDETAAKESPKGKKKKGKHYGKDASEQGKATEAAPTPACDLRHVPPSRLSTISGTFSSKTLITVKIALIHRGVPKTCARIYRLPTIDKSLHIKWLEQILSAKNKSKTKHPRKQPFIDTFATDDASNHAYSAAQMSSIIGPKPYTKENRPETETPRAGDPNYPHVPGEEDLIGFITTGNFNLGQGKGTGIGCLALKKVEGELRNGGKGGLCIVREVGMALGRVGRWEVCG
ncbi:MAG: hypothetical protein MMC33_003292 [Icmadophila ericetorum]|nr:hypothetical protein [Icmadophila ericetorum]